MESSLELSFLHSLRRSLLFESCDDVLCVMTTFCAIARSFRLSEEKIRLRILPTGCFERREVPVTRRNNNPSQERNYSSSSKRSFELRFICAKFRVDTSSAAADGAASETASICISWRSISASSEASADSTLLSFD